VVIEHPPTHQVRYRTWWVGASRWQYVKRAGILHYERVHIEKGAH
jgi:hypothetical protein